MPSTATITSWTTFTANTTARSADVNNNFNNFRGHFICVDPTATGSNDNAYDVGSITHRWRDFFLGTNFYIGDVNTAGGWRVKIGGATTTSLAFQYYSSTAYVTKYEVLP